MDNWTGKTFFLTMWDKSIVNMGLVPNWDKIEELRGNLDTAIRELSPNYYGALCISADGAKHVHLAISFDKAKRVNQVAKLLGNAHTEPMRGTKEQAQDYIEKRGKFEEKGEKILAYIGSKASMKDNSGDRIDLQMIREDVQNGVLNASTFNEYIFTRARTESQARAIESAYNRVMGIMGGQMRKVEVIYVEGETGSGKTRGAYTRYKDVFRASVSDRTSFPFNGYHGERVLLLDELRPNQFKPAELFQILDGYPMTVDIKGGKFPAMWTTVLITTAMPMDDWYRSKDDQQGQDNNRKQFERRITCHYQARDGEWHEYDAQAFEPLSEDTECPFT